MLLGYDDDRAEDDACRDDGQAKAKAKAKVKATSKSKASAAAETTELVALVSSVHEGIGKLQDMRQWMQEHSSVASRTERRLDTLEATVRGMDDKLDRVLSALSASRHRRCSGAGLEQG